MILCADEPLSLPGTTDVIWCKLRTVSFKNFSAILDIAWLGSTTTCSNGISRSFPSCSQLMVLWRPDLFFRVSVLGQWSPFDWRESCMYMCQPPAVSTPRFGPSTASQKFASPKRYTLFHSFSCPPLTPKFSSKHAKKQEWENKFTRTLEVWTDK